MLPKIRGWVRRLRERLPLRGPVLEIGSYRVNGQEELADMRPFFEGEEYLGVDMREGLGVDEVHDFCDPLVSIRGGWYSTVLCLETLEHVHDPRQLLANVHFALAEGGWLVVTTTMGQMIHNHPNDYWRFTPNGLRLLLSSFSTVRVLWNGDKRRPDSVVGIASMGYPSIGYPIDSNDLDDVLSEVHI